MHALLRIPYMLLACLLTLTGCSAGLAGLYGMKKIRPVDAETITRFARRYHIPAADSYALDTACLHYLLTQDSSRYGQQIKNHAQPLQALYFGPDRQLVSFQVNCYAGGFLNLNWERNGIQETFPPGLQAPLDSLLPFDQLLGWMRPLPASKPLLASEYDYVVIVCWTRFMTRQSRRLVRTVQENARLAGDKSVKILYANADNLFAVRLGQQEQ